MKRGFIIDVSQEEVDKIEELKARFKINNLVKELLLDFYDKMKASEG